VLIVCPCSLPSIYAATNKPFIALSPDGQPPWLRRGSLPLVGGSCQHGSGLPDGVRFCHGFLKSHGGAARRIALSDGATS
jgi:hypothetical protein